VKYIQLSQPISSSIIIKIFRIISYKYFSPLWCNKYTRARATLFSRFLDHTQWHNTLRSTPLDEGSARCWYLCLTTHNTHKRHTWLRRDFFLFFFSVCTSSFPASLSSLSCSLSFCLYLQHNTNIHVPDGIRARSPSKRSAADSRVDRSTSGIGHTNESNS
jgi:hypothetical protein